MNIIFLTQWDLSIIDNGEKKRSVFIINTLKEYGINVIVQNPRDFEGIEQEIDYIFVDNLSAFVPRLIDYRDVKKMLLMDYVESIEKLEEKTNGNFEYRVYTNDEDIKKMSIFDKIFFISFDEYLFFAKILSKEKCEYLPMIPDKIIPLYQKVPFENKKYDLVFTATAQEKNLQSIEFFLERIYPHINIGKMLINGPVVKLIKNKELYTNIDFIEWSENLEDIYLNSKLSLSPILYGTGVKTKVLTSLSFGVPTIGTLRAEQGLLKKGKDIGFVECKNEEEMIKNINLFLQNKFTCNEFSKKAIDYVLSSHNKNMFDKIILRNIGLNEEKSLRQVEMSIIK